MFPVPKDTFARGTAFFASDGRTMMGKTQLVPKAADPHAHKGPAGSPISLYETYVGGVDDGHRWMSITSYGNVSFADHALLTPAGVFELASPDGAASVVLRRRGGGSGGSGGSGGAAARGRDTQTLGSLRFEGAAGGHEGASLRAELDDQGQRDARAGTRLVLATAAAGSAGGGGNGGTGKDAGPVDRLIVDSAGRVTITSSNPAEGPHSAASSSSSSSSSSSASASASAGSGDAGDAALTVAGGVRVGAASSFGGDITCSKGCGALRFDGGAIGDVQRIVLPAGAKRALEFTTAEASAGGKDTGTKESNHGDDDDDDDEALVMRFDTAQRVITLGGTLAQQHTVGVNLSGGNVRVKSALTVVDGAHATHQLQLPRPETVRGATFTICNIDAKAAILGVAASPGGGSSGGGGSSASASASASATEALFHKGGAKAAETVEIPQNTCTEMISDALRYVSLVEWTYRVSL